VEKASARQQKEATEAQEATRRRNEADEALTTWINGLAKVAELALAEQPQKLALLGLD
jgi:hypothetical protein